MRQRYFNLKLILFIFSIFSSCYIFPGNNLNPNEASRKVINIDDIKYQSLFKKKKGVIEEKYKNSVKYWQNKTIKALYIEDYAPFVYVDDKGRLKGITIDLWREIAKRNKFKYELNILRGKGIWNKTVDLIASNKYDIAVTPHYVTPKREKFVDFARPFYIERFGVAIRKNEKKLTQIAAEVLGDLGIIFVTVGSFFYSNVCWSSLVF